MSFAARARRSRRRPRALRARPPAALATPCVRPPRPVRLRPPARPTRLPPPPPPPTSSLGRDERPLVAAPPSPDPFHRVASSTRRRTTRALHPPPPPRPPFAAPPRSSPARRTAHPVADADVAQFHEIKATTRPPRPLAVRRLGAGPDANPAACVLRHQDDPRRTAPRGRLPGGVERVLDPEEKGTRVATAVERAGRRRHPRLRRHRSPPTARVCSSETYSPRVQAVPHQAVVRRLTGRRARSGKKRGASPIPFPPPRVVPFPPFVAPRPSPARPSLSTHVPLRLFSRRERRWAPRRRRRRRGGPPAFLSVSRFYGVGKGRSAETVRRRRHGRHGRVSRRVAPRGSPRAGRTREETSRGILWSS